MASLIIFGILILLLETNIISGTCTEHDYGTQNVVLEFNFGWIISETRHVNCFYGSNKIGECYDAFGFICPLEQASRGVYNMSPNVDLTGVTVTIIRFSSTTAGNYSCSKNIGTTTFTKCVKDSSRDNGGWTYVCILGLVLGIILVVFGTIDVVVLAITLFKLAQNRKQCNRACCCIMRCLTLMIGLGVVVVSIAVGYVGFHVGRYICEEGWSIPGIVAIVFGFIGDILLIAMCIVTIIARLEHSVIDLHYGLVFSHISGFMRYAQTDLIQVLNGKCQTYNTNSDKFIKIFLLVIPNTCIVPESTVFFTDVFKEDTLQRVEEVDYDGYKVNIYKLRMQNETHYICAQVPAVLTVISKLSQKRFGMILVCFVRQRFQKLYQKILDINGWNETIKLVTCKGERDIARALFEAAVKVLPDSKKGKASNPTSVSCLMTRCKQYKVTPENMKKIITRDVIPGLAWDYVYNYLMQNRTNTFKSRIQTYRERMLKENTPITCGFIPKLIIVWLKSCNTEKLLNEEANKGKRQTSLVTDHIGEQDRWVERLEEDQMTNTFYRQNGPPFKVNIFKIKYADPKKDRCFLAGYCPPMQCVKMMGAAYGMPRETLEEQGPRFKDIFDKIMSSATFQTLFNDNRVSLIYFDDVNKSPQTVMDVSGSSKRSLIDLLEAEFTEGNRNVLY